jgi:fructoselysine 6-kinase
VAVSLACVGDNCIDRYIDGAEVAQVGGNAVNVAVGLARGGFETAYYGAVGNDPDGVSIRTALASAGVDTSAVEVRSEPTGVTLVELRPNGDRIFVEERYGASSRYRPSTEALAALDRRTWVHGVGLTDPTDLLALETARVSYDFSDTAAAGLLETLAPRLEIAFISAANGDREHALEQARTAVAAGATAAVVTRGGEGALAWNGHLVERSADPVAVVDTLGAGDALIAAVIGAHVRGAAMEAALDQGARAAAHTCTHHGAWEAA